MLTNPIMGAVALAILWVNTLLVAAAAWQQVRALLRRRSALAGAVRATVVRGDGEGGAIAAHRVDQVGRAAEGEPAILFHDRAAKGEIAGGVIAIDGREITIAPRAEAEVWLAPGEIAEAAACPSQAAFDEAFPAARKARGFSRTVVAPLRAGREVFVCGAIEGGDGEILFAAVDPRSVLARKAALAAAFLAGEILIAAACTAVALTPPLFGRVSTVGGALCLLFFLLVQPAGTAVRDAVLVPSRAILRGAWRRAALSKEAAATA